MLMLFIGESYLQEQNESMEILWKFLYVLCSLCVSSESADFQSADKCPTSFIKVLH